MDVALELFEWIFTGFQDEEISKLILNTLTNSRFEFQKEHLEKIHLAYTKLLKEETK